MVKKKKDNYLIRKNAILKQKIMKKNNASVYDVPGVSTSVLIIGESADLCEDHRESTSKPPEGCWRQKITTQHRLHFFPITIILICSFNLIIVSSSCVSSEVYGKRRKLWIDPWIFIYGRHRLATNVSSCYSCLETEAASADINVRIVRWRIRIGRRSKRLSPSTLQRFANLIFITVNAQHKGEKRTQANLRYCCNDHHFSPV